jgi:hypothetical protein
VINIFIDLKISIFFFVAKMITPRFKLELNFFKFHNNNLTYESAIQKRNIKCRKTIFVIDYNFQGRITVPTPMCEISKKDPILVPIGMFEN